MASRSRNSGCYWLSPDMALERFGDRAVVLLAHQDRWITVNGSAASLLEIMTETFGARRFSGADLADLITRHYGLAKARAAKASESLLADWTKRGMLIMNSPRKEKKITIMGKARPKITLDTKLVPNPNMFLREEDDEGGILFDPNSGAVRILNRPAAETWKLLDGHRTVTEVIAGLKEKFNGMGADAEKQVLELAGELHRLSAVGLAVKGKS